VPNIAATWSASKALGFARVAWNNWQISSTIKWVLIDLSIEHCWQRQLFRMMRSNGDELEICAARQRSCLTRKYRVSVSIASFRSSHAVAISWHCNARTSFGRLRANFPLVCGSAQGGVRGLSEVARACSFGEVLLLRHPWFSKRPLQFSWGFRVIAT